MKLTKVSLTISVLVFLAIIILVARFGYSFGQHNASLTVKEATPMQLAEAMQSDNFYGEYTKTMLLVNGTVMAVNKQGADTIAHFEVTNSSTALGKVSCDLGSNTGVKAGENIRILTVAYDAERKNTADVFMPNCYLINE